MYYVATYGNLGLVVDFYSDPDEYERARAKAQADWEADRIDSYINDDVPSRGEG